jgi:hypothetical protein
MPALETALAGGGAWRLVGKLERVVTRFAELGVSTIRLGLLTFERTLRRMRALK